MRRFQRLSRVVAVTTAGFLLLTVGVALLFLPGPGLLLIVAGLAVLAGEYRWADRARHHAATRVRGVRDRARLHSWRLTTSRRSHGAPPSADAPGRRPTGAAASDPAGDESGDHRPAAA